jgi:Glycosyl transferase family 2
MKFTLEIVILTCDRPSMLKQSLASVITQQVSFSLKTIVSDNSRSEDTSEMLSSCYPNIATRRYNSIPSYEHFREAVHNSQAQYIMLFHDDDVLLPGCLQALVNSLDHNPEISAASCNAYISFGDQCSSRTMIRKAKSNILISNEKNLVERYLDYWQGGVAPLSAYVYRKSAIKPDYIDFRTGGKYSDVCMLLQVLSNGPILWLSMPLAIYRVHEYSDNSTFSARDKLLLLRTLAKTYGLHKNSILHLIAKSDIYKRYYNINPNILKVLSRSLSKKERFVNTFILKTSLLRLFYSKGYALHLVKKFLNCSLLFRFIIYPVSFLVR